jgi:hypothetical protein
MLTSYDPNHLLDKMLEHLKLKNDAALSRALDVGPPLISKMRHARLPIGGAILLRLHDVTGISVGALRKMMGDRRQKFRLSSEQGRPKS